MGRFANWAARVIWLAVLALSSFYCALAYVPFTWHQVIQGKLIGALSDFANLQGPIYLAALVVLSLTLLPALRRAESRIPTAGFLGAALPFGIFLIAQPVLPQLGNDGASLYWAFAFLVPVIALSTLDFHLRFADVIWATRPVPADSRVFRASCFAAVFSAVLYAAIATSAGRGASFALATTVAAAHLALFLQIFAAAVLISGLAAAAFYPAKVEFILFEVFAAFLLFRFLDATVFPAMSFTGTPALMFGAAFALAIGFAFAGLSLAIYKESAQPVPAGLDVMLLPVTIFFRQSWIAIASGIVLLSIAAWVAQRQASGFDWNYLLQQSAAILVWGLAFALFFFAPFRALHRRRVLPLLLCALIATLAFRIASVVPAAAADAQTYAGVNASFRLASSILSPPVGDRSFYDFLSARSNISRAVDIQPVDFRIVPNLQATSGPKPNIFVIVIDSLRRDYVSAYNPKVTFTPGIDSFARESIVMKNAFTHYGGTGLAEPSIWTGGMIVHKQYVTPFYPMNTLAKLVNTEGYKDYVSMDNILDTVTPRTPNVAPLDAGKLTMDFDLCGSLNEVESKVSTGDPAFIYTQPQNIHISVITRENQSVPAGESYPGFYAPYASRLRRIDACFGRFIDSLKAKNLYDSSIVILTADHGDSLGEDGRFGHAYTLFPEIVKIPMIIHLPRNLASGLVYSADKPAFSMDITPTLYYLLGHTGTISNPLFGRPLFTHTKAEQQQYDRPDYLIAASYASVYALLTDNAQRLFISDAVNEKDYLYDVNSNTSLNLPAQVVSADRSEIAKLIDLIDQEFHFTPVAH